MKQSYGDYNTSLELNNDRILAEFNIAVKEIVSADVEKNFHLHIERFSSYDTAEIFETYNYYFLVLDGRIVGFLDKYYHEFWNVLDYWNYYNSYADTLIFNFLQSFCADYTALRIYRFRRNYQ